MHTLLDGVETRLLLGRIVVDVKVQSSDCSEALMRRDVRSAYLKPVYRRTKAEQQATERVALSYSVGRVDEQAGVSSTLALRYEGCWL